MRLSDLPLPRLILLRGRLNAAAQRMRYRINGATMSIRDMDNAALLESTRSEMTRPYRVLRRRARLSLARIESLIREGNAAVVDRVNAACDRAGL